MKNKKIIIAIVVIIVIAIAGTCIYFGVKAYKTKKYQQADEYEVGSEKITSVKAVLGEKKVTKYTYEKSNVEILTLTFEDSDKEESVNKYLEYLKDNGNYITMRTEDSNKQQIANPSDELITVQTEITDTGFILTIEVGPGTIRVDETE